MSKLIRALPAAVVALTVFAGCGLIAQEKKGSPVPKPPAKAEVTMNPAILKDFQQRLAHYVEFQRGVEKGTPKQKETTEPIKIELAQTLLASKIRNLRKNAKQGDIFTPQIAAEFKRLMNPELKGEEGGDARAVLKDDAPSPGEVPLKVNADYPSGVELPTVPSTILQALPGLPEDVEYRIVNKALLLRDVDANIIVDFIPNAVR
jgi:hypothetical protein